MWEGGLNMSSLDTCSIKGKDEKSGNPFKLHRYVWKMESKQFSLSLGSLQKL
jgi:hypothetical protein